MTQQKNQQIDCNLYDFLESWATKKEKVDIVYNQQDETSQQVVILDLFVTDHKEYLKTTTGITIPLLEIISVNGILFQKHCS